MKKKLLSLALVLAMALTLMPTAAFAASADEVDLPEENQEITTEAPDLKLDETDGQEEADDAEEPGDELPGQGAPEVPEAPAAGYDVCPPHTLTEVPEVPATCKDAGTKKHWHCDLCDLDFLSGDVNDNQPADNLTLPKRSYHDWSNKDGVCKVCGEVCDHAADTNKNDAVCSVCGAAYASQNGCGHFTARTKVTRGEATCSAPGYAMAIGDEAWYCAQCRKYYTTETGNDTVTVTVTPATNRHVRREGSVKSPSASGHIYICDVCEKEIGESHIYGDDNVCDYCGYVRGSSVTPSPYDYISISSAYLYRYSISVSWQSSLPDGTSFDIYVDGVQRASGVRPSKSSSGYFGYTVDFSYYLSDSYYTVTVYAHNDHSISNSARTYNRYYDYDYDYWYPDHYYPNGTPSTNSYGIPYASQVNGRYSAAEAIRILRNKNQYNLQNDLMSSSSALDSYERLESAVKSANSVSVNVSVDRNDVPSALRSGSGIRITGAAFNASHTNSTVRLVVDGPSVNRYAGRGYQFSMTLTGVDSASSLDVPVVVSMPLPSDISANYVKVLHYHNSNVPTVITPKVSGGRISFPLTGFSDFVVTDGGVPNYTYVSDGYGGYYIPAAAPRRSLIDEHLSVVLPIIASTPANGYIYDDVSGTYWAAPQIAWVTDGGLMTGYFDGTFRPYSGTTRQELWMVLARLSGANPADMWAAREWAMNVGITDGTNPHSPLSNQQMITMLYRYASYRRMNLTAPTTMLSLYHDSASVSAYARTPMAWAINKGIVNGNGTGYLYPQNIATRADFAVYLYRFLQ